MDNYNDRLKELQAQVLLRRFQTELSDVTVEADLQVNIDGFLRFADYFFDGLFADWTVLERIEQSSAQMRETSAKISCVLGTLADMENAARAELSRLTALRDEKIMNADL